MGVMVFAIHHIVLIVLAGVFIWLAIFINAARNINRPSGYRGVDDGAYGERRRAGIAAGEADHASRLAAAESEAITHHSRNVKRRHIRKAAGGSAKHISMLEKNDSYLEKDLTLIRAMFSGSRKAAKYKPPHTVEVTKPERKSSGRKPPDKKGGK
jgi:hypothetical protein